MPASARANGHPHLASIRAAALRDQILQLGILEKKTSLAEMGQQEYRDAWAWVHFMMHGPAEARDVLVTYIGELRQGVPSAPISTRLVKRLGQPQQLLTAHFRGRNDHPDNGLRQTIPTTQPEIVANGVENH